MDGQEVKQATDILAREKDYNLNVVSPSQEYLHKWLMDNHRIHIAIEPDKSKDDTVIWFSHVVNLAVYDLAYKQFQDISPIFMGETYVEAYEQALVAALNLIK
jgi:hypothetical protein